MNPAVRTYVKSGLSATPLVVGTLLQHLTLESEEWDKRPDPERFSLREVVAHLADWEPIWLERFVRINDEDEPILPGIDEGEIAIERNYSKQDPLVNIQRFLGGRASLLAHLSQLTGDQWNRAGVRSAPINRIAADDLAAMILGHDGYHLEQIVEWLE